MLTICKLLYPFCQRAKKSRHFSALAPWWMSYRPSDYQTTFALRNLLPCFLYQIWSLLYQSKFEWDLNLPQTLRHFNFTTHDLKQKQISSFGHGPIWVWGLFFPFKTSMPLGYSVTDFLPERKTKLTKAKLKPFRICINSIFIFNLITPVLITE